MRLLCIGLAADETYVHTIAAFKHAHVAFHALWGAGQIINHAWN
jgi:hypothetical protein